LKERGNNLHLNVTTQLPHNVSYRPDVFLEQLAGLRFRLPRAAGSTQTGDDVIFDAESVVDETARSALLLSQSILELGNDDIPR
jgi:hypothetical protein